MKINKMKKQSANLAVVLCVVGALSGCSTVNDVRDMTVSKPAADAGFIANPERQGKVDYLPFQKVWIAADFNKDNYSEIVVAPVNTQYMQEMDWLHKASSASWFSDVQKDINELAGYFQNTVAKEFRLDPNHRFTVLDIPEQHKAPALRLEIALVEIDPSMPVLHAAGWAVVGGGVAANTINQRTAAFEGRLRDMQTNQIVATFADRQAQDISPADLTNLSWYGPAKGIMDNWAKQFVEIANRKPGEKVVNVPFTLKPF